MAMRELKFPMLKHSRAVSIQYSITFTRSFFLTCCWWKERKIHTRKRKYTAINTTLTFKSRYCGFRGLSCFHLHVTSTETLVTYHITTQCHNPEDLDLKHLKMESAWTSETSVPCHITTRCHNTEDHDVNLHHRENLKSHNALIFPSITVGINQDHALILGLFNDALQLLRLCNVHVMWVPVTMAWRIFGLWMEEMASRYKR
jgi:hypothetical protein